MTKGKAKAFELIKDEFRAKFGRDLTSELYKYTFRGYSSAIKEIMVQGKIVRLTYLGTLQPSKSRLKLNTNNKDAEKLGEIEQVTYLCGVNEKYKNSFFKPLSYDILTGQKKDT